MFLATRLTSIILTTKPSMCTTGDDLIGVGFVQRLAEFTDGEQPGWSLIDHDNSLHRSCGGTPAGSAALAACSIVARRVSQKALSCPIP